MVEMGYPYHRQGRGARGPTPDSAQFERLFAHQAEWCPNLDTLRFRLIRAELGGPAPAAPSAPPVRRPVSIDLTQRPRRHQRARGGSPKRSAATYRKPTSASSASSGHATSTAQVRYVLARIIWYVEGQRNRQVGIENCPLVDCIWLLSNRAEWARKRCLRGGSAMSRACRAPGRSRDPVRFRSRSW
jgi:hypothetical protein